MTKLRYKGFLRFASVKPDIYAARHMAIVRTVVVGRKHGSSSSFILLGFACISNYDVSE